MDTEQNRISEARKGTPWRKWGPYPSERQWGTVREDYSPGRVAYPCRGPACLLGAADRARYGSRPDRSPRSAPWSATRAGSPRPRPNPVVAQARTGVSSRSDLPLLQRCRHRLCTGRYPGVHRCRGGSFGFNFRHCREWSRVPYGGRTWQLSTKNACR